jgi:hypothetical protein
MAEGTWTHYKLQRQIFSIGEDFWIENDRGEQLFKVDGMLAAAIASTSCPRKSAAERFSRAASKRS